MQLDFGESQSSGQSRNSIRHKFPEPNILVVYFCGANTFRIQDPRGQYSLDKKSLEARLMEPESADLPQFESKMRGAEYPSVPHLGTFIFLRFYNGFLPLVPGANASRGHKFAEPKLPGAKPSGANSLRSRSSRSQYLLRIGMIVRSGDPYVPQCCSPVLRRLTNRMAIDNRPPPNDDKRLRSPRVRTLPVAAAHPRHSVPSLFCWKDFLFCWKHFLFCWKEP